MYRFKRRPSPAMVVAILALIAGVAGTAIAAVPVTKKTVNTIITKRAPGLSVSHANTADTANNANKLNNLDADALASAGAFDQRGTADVLTTTPATVLSATITTPAQKVLTAVASIGAVSDGGGDDNITCNLKIDAVAGASQSTIVTTNTAPEDSTTLPVTQGAIVGAGTHTVIAECSDATNSDTVLGARNLNVVATG